MISCLAATSMPRVGSSRISSCGSVASQRASIAFCWLPPESGAIGVSTSARGCRALRRSGRRSRVCRAGERKRQHAEPRLQRQRRCSRAATARRRCRRSCALRGRTPGRGAIACAGLAKRTGAPSMRSSPLSRLSSAEQQPRQLGAARAEQAGEAEDLAARARRGRPAAAGRAGRARAPRSSGSPALSTPAPGAPSRPAATLSSRPTIAAISACGGSSAAQVLADALAVAQHRDAIARSRRSGRGSG